MEQEQIRNNIEQVRARIARAAERAGRDPGEVRLIAVTKTVSPEIASMAVLSGVPDIGENRVQEYLHKRDAMNCEINLHFIGQLQRNKVKYIIGDAALIHSVDRTGLADEISRRAVKLGRRVPVLLEVAFDRSGERGGVLPEELPDLAHYVNGLEGIELRGLMCVAPVGASEDETRACFRALRGMRDRLQAEGMTLPELSMGMSGDFELAVEEGATMVRVGTSVFGARQ